MSKFDRLIKDQENIAEQEYQDHLEEITKSKIVLCIPYEKGSPEYANFKLMFGDIIRDNEGCSIIECDKCEDCGVINETVEQVTFDDDISGKRVSMLLCTYCAITSAGMT